MDFEVLDFGISDVYCGWDLVGCEDYVVFYIGQQSSSVFVSSVSPYRSIVGYRRCLAGCL